MKVWVLTREINQYDQDGAYFETVFAEKPTVKVVADYLTGKVHMRDVMAALALCEHIVAGGGRIDSEDVWFNLEEVEAR